MADPHEHPWVARISGELLILDGGAQDVLGAPDDWRDNQLIDKVNVHNQTL